MIGITLKHRKSTEWIGETECYDRHYQEHKRKQIQMGGPRDEET